MKKIFKNITAFLMVLLMIITLSSCQTESDTLHIGFSPDYAPYEFVDLTKTDDEKYVGADIELAKYICQKLDKKIVFEPMGFGQILISLQSGKIDLAISGFNQGMTHHHINLLKGLTRCLITNLVCVGGIFHMSTLLFFGSHPVIALL